MTEYVCEVCGRATKYKLRADGKAVCSKHYQQFQKHGKFLDANPRTPQDPNEFWIEGEKAYMGLYDKKNRLREVVEFDREDIPKVKNIKWAYANGYAVNFRKSKQRQLHKVILDTDQTVDHIDGNRLNNHKSNLREASIAENNYNRPTAKGVYCRDGNFYSSIKKDGILHYLGAYNYRSEAEWARWYAERIVFKEFARQAEEPKISEKRKDFIKTRIDKKLNA